ASSSRTGGQGFPAGFDHGIHCDAELVVDVVHLSGCAETMHTHEPTIEPEISVPAILDGSLYSDPRRSRAEYLPLVLGRLSLEQESAWHRDDGGPHTFGLQPIPSLDCQMEF